MSRFAFIFALLFSLFAIAAETYPTYSEVQGLPGRVKAAEANLCAMPSVGPDGKPCPETKPKTGSSSVVAAAAAAQRSADLKRELSFYEAFKLYGTSSYGMYYSGTSATTAADIKAQIAGSESSLIQFPVLLARLKTEVAPYLTLKPLFVGDSIPKPVPTVSSEGLAKFSAQLKTKADEAANSLKVLKDRIAELQTRADNAKPPAERASAEESIKYYTPRLAIYDQKNNEAQQQTVCISDMKPLNCPASVVEGLRAALERQTSNFTTQIDYYQAAVDKLHARINDLKKLLAVRETLDSQLATGATPTDEQKLAALELQYSNAVTGMTQNSGYQDCGMSVGERLAIAYYAGSGYHSINNALRQGGEALAKMQPIIDELNDALKHLKPFDGYVVRGGSLPPTVKAGHTLGAVVTYQAFTSTSLASGFSANDRFIIHSRNGRYIGSYSSSYNESEVLIPSNSRFKILDVKVEGSVTTYVMDEVAP